MVGRSVLEGRRGVRAWLLAALACLLLCAAASLLAAAQADAIQRLAQCADNVDNDGDGDVDFPEDAGCATAAITTETPDAVTQCSDNIDQPGTSDGDAFVDYPEDPGCTSAADTNENNPSPLPQCGNAVDDDGDGRTNFNLNRFLTDHGCIAASDNSELNTTCSDGIDNDGDGRTDFPLDWGCAVPSAGPNQADTDEADPPQCRDGRDNDGDALIDTDTNIPGQARDPDCADPDDRDEAPDPQCADARDNDRDGRTDFPADPGCTSASDDDETDPPGVCADGLDNDADGLVDLLDPGCSAADDGDETNVTYQLPPVIGGTVRHAAAERAVLGACVRSRRDADAVAVPRRAPGGPRRTALHQDHAPAGGAGAGRGQGHGLLQRCRLPAQERLAGGRHAQRARAHLRAPGARRHLAADLRHEEGLHRQVHALQDPAQPAASAPGPLRTLRGRRPQTMPGVLKHRAAPTTTLAASGVVGAR